jgi:hypothetical protein
MAYLAINAFGASQARVTSLRKLLKSEDFV